MTVDDVLAAIAASDEPTMRVWIGDGSRLPPDDNVSVLVKQPDGVWLTAYFERGAYQGPRTFATEDEACRDFMKRVRLPVADGPS